jgi:hypothetical protein
MSLPRFRREPDENKGTNCCTHTNDNEQRWKKKNVNRKT